MKLIYTIEPSEEHPGMLDIHTRLEDEEPLLDVKISVPPELIESQFPCVAQTLLRWWYRKTARELAKDPNFKTLKEVQNGK